MDTHSIWAELSTSQVPKKYGELFVRPRGTICQPYLDDNLVHSISFEDNLAHVCFVLQCYKEHGVNITQEKM